MPCYNPVSAWKGEKSPDGKIKLEWRRNESFRGEELLLPCGNCLGCRLDRSRDWAIRCMHEAQMWDENCFLTLTYEKVPENGSVDVEEFQRFMKRLRKYAGKKLRFFHCGEYGSKLSRPHYHALIFGFDFHDKYLYSVRNGNNLYRSGTLEKLWGKGFATIGSVTAQTASYVARYVLKKVNGELAQSHYEGKNPEYITMSRDGGIGKSYFEKFKDDIYPGDFCLLDGKKVPVPSYYDKLLEKSDPIKFNMVKDRRRRMGLKLAKDNDSFRRDVKETVKEAAIKTLTRKLEE